MKILKIKQNTEEWLEFKRGKHSGSRAKATQPLSRGTDRTPKGFWDLVAEKISIPVDAEKPMDRGHRLENEALELTAQKFGLDLDLEPGIWISDEREDVILSPDASERSDTPTYAAESKSLNSGDHIKYVTLDRQAKILPVYNPIDSVPSDYKPQVIDYFVVNENLYTLYFTLFDPRIIFEHLAHYVIVIKREHIADLIEAQKNQQLETMRQVDKLIAEIIK